MIYSRAVTPSLHTAHADCVLRHQIPISIQGSDSDLDPLVPRLNLLPAVSRSQLGNPRSTTSALSPSIRFRCTHRRTMGQSYLLAVSGSASPPLATTRRIVSPRFSFFFFRSSLFYPFYVSMLRDFSFIPVDRLVHDNEPVAQLQIFPIKLP